ncbi:hypothetical protein ADICYQ_5512 [Cyclobacterium qasimii M12-11B]|uniref:Uncharacterized protein n=1 Tax=Cyclobacterium qasimii M12-11B TaxID=641524 RepID=S7V6L8_9BACT|nr:hypothetical protein ADICYQ_5512 [Cyclobacterium qasimii M12-11B]
MEFSESSQKVILSCNKTNIVHFGVKWKFCHKLIYGSI